MNPIPCPFGLFCPTADSPAAPIEIIFSRVIGLLTIVAGLAFLIYFMLGALNWITGGEDKGKVDTAKKYMTNGAIGMIAIISSYAVIWVVGTVLGLDILNPAEVINTLSPGNNPPAAPSAPTSIPRSPFQPVPRQ
jgi:hypothetical protein